ncbi:MAG: PxKF domain-containing protein [Acidobacteria bacterium]|nr:PxKF domain-containing protein [Acidobacteriota bacterium]
MTRVLSLVSAAIVLVWSSLVITAQTAPTAVLDGPQQVTIGQNIALSGSQSFAGTGRTIVRYEWRLDGGIPVSTAVPAHIFVADPSAPFTVGAHDAELVVIDDQGTASLPVTRRIIVADTVAPTAVIDVSPVVGVGADVPVSGARSFDVGGRVVQYEWALDGGAPIRTEAPTFTFLANPAAPLVPGRHAVSLVVSDDAGNQSLPALAEFIVTDTVAPTAVIDVPPVVAFGSNVPVSGAHSFDVGGRVVQYDWALDGAAPIRTDQPAFTFLVNPAAPLVPGRHTVSLRVTDDSGNWSQPALAEFIVADTVAPTAVIDVPPVVAFGTDVPVSGARSSDVGGQIVRYLWTLDGGAPILTDQPTFTFLANPAAPLVPGRHTVSLVVTDDSGNQSSPAAANFIVADTTAPTAVLDVPALVGLGASFTLSGARSFDVGGQIMRYAWTVDGEAPIVTDVPTFVVVVNPAAPLALGTHIVQLVVTDDAGNQSQPALASVRVVDSQVPTAVVSVPAVVTVGQSFSVSGAQSFDADGTIVAYHWTIDAQPVVVTSGADFTVVVDPAAPLAVGRHTLQLVVVDDAGLQSPPALAQFIVADTLAPTAVIDVPAFIRYGDPITASGARSFDVGGRITRYDWTLDGLGLVSTDMPTVSFPFNPAAPFAPGLHTIELAVTDDSGNRSPVESAQVRVTDGVAPTAVVVVPPLVQVGQSVTASGADSFDVGGTVVRYEWTLDQQPVLATDVPTVTFGGPAAPLSVGRHTVELSVVDDSGNRSQPDVAQFIVVDSIAPTAVLDAPVSIVVGQPLLVSGARSFDVGGRVVRYIWTLDGGGPIQTEVASFTFGSGALAAVGRHVVQLVVTDDSGNQSQPDTKSVDVLPPADTTPPTIVVTTPPPGARYVLHQAVAANYTCADSQSGVASCTGTTAAGAGIDTATVGAKSFTVTARDVAGNQAQVTHTYSVGYVFTGFFPPVDNLPVTNAVNAGRTIPLKWRLADGAGKPVTALSSFVSLRDAAVACDASPEALLEEQLTATAASTLHARELRARRAGWPNSGGRLHYDAAADQFVYHWRTEKGMRGCRMVQLTLADGSTHRARFRLR